MKNPAQATNNGLMQDFSVFYVQDVIIGKNYSQSSEGFSTALCATEHMLSMIPSERPRTGV